MHVINVITKVLDIVIVLNLELHVIDVVAMMMAIVIGLQM